MIKIKFIGTDNAEITEEANGRSLFEILRGKGYSIYSPCGGKGTCGKCTIKVSGEGDVVSCKYNPDKDIEITMPREDEANILIHQTEYLEDLQFSRGKPDHHSRNPYGVAIDIGTTTLVFYFVSLVSGQVEKISSGMNPQRLYGADVITRINFCQEQEDGLSILQNSIVSAINKELDSFIKRDNLLPENIERIIIIGNTTMIHLFLGEDPISIALAPFTPKFTDKQVREGHASKLNVNPNAEVITLPCQTAYVGADIIAGLASLKPGYRNYLFLDIGTNGEMALVKDGKIYTCATAAGPAFEGANISCGMAAVTGAISHFNGTNDLQVIGNSTPSGICGSGIVDIVAYMVNNEMIDGYGLLKKPFIIDDSRNIMVSQHDIREIQLAKSAIFSGIRVLMKATQSTYESIDALFLAGGFGNYISIRSAVEIGLLPCELEDKIFPVGNSAGIGALQYLKSDVFEEKINNILSNSTYIELSNLDDFTTEFALNMNFTKCIK